MRDIEELVRGYVATWNEADATARRTVIDRSWAPEGVYRNAVEEFHGHEGIERAVTQAHDAFVASGFLFRVAEVDRVHDAVRYRWEMVPAAGGPADSIGTHVAMLDREGRLAVEHQFIDAPPS